jgi:hypothetical protein
VGEARGETRELVVAIGGMVELELWRDRNCARCVKGWGEATGYSCPLEESIDEAAVIGDGTLDPATARRVGSDGRGGVARRCREFVEAQQP